MENNHYLTHSNHEKNVWDLGPKIYFIYSTGCTSWRDRSKGSENQTQPETEGWCRAQTTSFGSDIWRKVNCYVLFINITISISSPLSHDRFLLHFHVRGGSASLLRGGGGCQEVKFCEIWGSGGLPMGIPGKFKKCVLWPPFPPPPSACHCM